MAHGAGDAHLRKSWKNPASLLLHSSSQGYLGVLVGDVDSDSANKLKLKDVHGAVITLIDHDAPAAQVGLRVNDVVLEVNGQSVESAEAFGRMMREIPAGRKVTMLISRDGATQTITVQLADRKKLDTDVWNKLNAAATSALRCQAWEFWVRRRRRCAASGRIPHAVRRQQHAEGRRAG